MLKNKFKHFIQQNKLLDNCEKLLLGVSGGPDSLAMLHLFFELREELGIEIAVAHLNHMFRSESDAEADFVKNYAKKLGISFYKKKVNLPKLIKKNKLSPEAAARQERFNFFKQIMSENNFEKLALGHHRDDQVETILLNLFRGSGLKGLSGIQKSLNYDKIKIIHPLLNFSKKELILYCRQNNLRARFDSSNKKNIYSRNIIRNKILPIVEKEINPGVRKVIEKNSEIISAENKFLEKLARQKYKKILITEKQNKIVIDFIKFKELDQVLQRRIYRHIYYKFNHDLENLYLDHIHEIEKLINDQQTGRGIDITAGIRVEISYSKLFFLKNKNLKTKKTKKTKINLNSKLKINDDYNLIAKIKKKNNFSFNCDNYRAAFDFEKLKLPLSFRSREDGDKLIPLGMTGHKKVKDILIDLKIPRHQRNKVPVIVDAEDNIIWLAPYKLSAEFKITKKTKKILILKLKSTKEDFNG